MGKRIGRKTVSFIFQQVRSIGNRFRYIKVSGERIGSVVSIRIGKRIDVMDAGPFNRAFLCLYTYACAS